MNNSGHDRIHYLSTLSQVRVQSNWCSLKVNWLISKIINLFFRDHQFESYKSLDYWRLTWSLTLRSVKLVEVYVNWSGHPH